jgi:LemA protein
MKNFLIGLAVVAGVLVILLAVFVSGYNRLVRLAKAADAQWAQVQNVYQRRLDLIPNLVQTVQGAANFEKSTLTAVIDARASVGRVTIDANSVPADAAKLAEFERAQGQLSSALSRLMVVVERYPDLKANENFRDLQAQLEGTENRIAVERGRFNDAVRDYNTAIHTLPGVFFAHAMGYTDKPYFAAAPAAATAPAVRFDFSTPSAPAKP